MKAPLEMPRSYFGQVEFDQQRIDYNSPEASGRVAGVQGGPPLWKGIWTVDVVGQDESDALRSFKDQVRGTTRRFLGRDLTRLYPKAHSLGFAGMLRAGGGAFDGSATGWSETITADGDSQVTLHGLPAGLTLGQCDYIGFRWVASEAAVAGLTWHACVRVAIGAAANGGGDLTVTSEPAVPLAVPPAAIAYLNEPACVMVLDTGQTSLQAVGRRNAIGGGQLVGLQDLRS